MEAMKKIIEAERQASSLVTEARVYKTMLLNQTKKKAQDQAILILAEAEKIRKQNEEETAIEIAKADATLLNALNENERNIQKQVAGKKEKIVKQLIVEVNKSDRPR